MLKQFDAGAQKVLEKEGEQRATILLTTGGGKVAFGEALTERIRFLSGFVDLRIVAATFVMSAGVRIFLALPKERRFITPNGIIMIHPQTRMTTPPVLFPTRNGRGFWTKTYLTSSSQSKGKRSGFGTWAGNWGFRTGRQRSFGEDRIIFPPRKRSSAALPKRSSASSP